MSSPNACCPALFPAVCGCPPCFLLLFPLPFPLSPPLPWPYGASPRSVVSVSVGSLCHRSFSSIFPSVLFCRAPPCFLPLSQVDPFLEKHLLAFSSGSLGGFGCRKVNCSFDFGLLDLLTKNVTAGNKNHIAKPTNNDFVNILEGPSFLSVSDVFFKVFLRFTECPKRLVFISGEQVLQKYFNCRSISVMT